MSCLKNSVCLVCCCLILKNTETNTPHPILDILLFWNIIFNAQCVFMHGIMITKKIMLIVAVILSYQFSWIQYRSREILLDWNLKLFKNYLLLPLSIHTLGTRTEWKVWRKVNAGGIKQMSENFVSYVLSVILVRAYSRHLGTKLKVCLEPNPENHTKNYCFLLFLTLK